MTELQKQVQRAQRRINFQSFLTASVWSLAICLGLAVVALGVTKIWHINVDPRQWQIGWLAGGVVVGLVAAFAWAWFKANSMVEAAVEIDQRFGLKERVSSSLSLSPEQADSDVGRALVADAAKRVARVDVKEQFGVRANKWAFLPFVTGAIAVALVFLPDAKPNSSANEANAKTVEVKKVRKSTTALQKKLAKKSEELDEKNLPEASKLAKKLENGINELSKKNADKRKSLVELNDLKNMLQQRRSSMKGSEELQKKLNQLKGMKVKDGPADKLAKAMQKGDFKDAFEQVKGLQQQLRAGTLDAKQMEKLAKQMDQMQKKMNEIVQQHEQAKKDLQKQLDDAKRQGNKAAARKLQKKMDQMRAQDEAMQKMQQMANQMQQMTKSMKEGNQQQAAQQMQQMANDLQAMQQEMAELEALDDMMDQLAAAKDSMNCDQCDGGG